MSQINLILRLGRRTVATVLATLTVLGGAGTAAVAAEPTAIGCPESAPVGPRPAGGDSAAAPAGQEEAVPVQQGTSGFRAYVDPETGQLTVPPEDAPAEEPTAAAALATSDEGLVAVPSPVPGGGNVVDLKGRFRSPLMATVDAEGKVEIHHAPCPGNSTQRK